MIGSFVCFVEVDCCYIGLRYRFINEIRNFTKIFNRYDYEKIMFPYF